MKNKIFLLLTILAVAFFANKALAQEKISMTVGPARQELRVDPGEQTRVEVRFYNTSEMPITGAVSAVDFVVIGSEGSPRLLDTPSEASPKYTGASWVSLPYDQITIAATDKVTIPVTIDVPRDAKPGGRYVAVYFQPGGLTPEGSRAGSAVTSRVASLLYIRVNGDITENAIVTRFYAPAMFEYGPVKVTTEILNRGDYHIRPKAIIAMTNLFGSLTDQVMVKEENIFPDSTRIFTTEIGPKWLFGRYKLSLMGSYGTEGKAIEAVTYVWVIPWRIIAIVVLAFLLIVILVKKLVSSSHQEVHELKGKLSAEEQEIEELKKMLRRKKD